MQNQKDLAIKAGMGGAYTLEKAEEPPRLTLQPKQVTTSKFLASRKRACDLSEMGFGKTAAAWDAADRTKAKRVLVICPAIVCTHWKREHGRVSTVERTIQIVTSSSDRIEGDVTIISYNLVGKKKIKKQLMNQQFDVAIFDEAHYLKNSNAIRTVAILGPHCDGSGIISRATHNWYLTGTPMPNHIGELYPLLRANWPERFEDIGLDYLSFIKRYAYRKQTKFGTQIYGSQNMDELNERRSGTFIRFTKKDLEKSLPPKRITTEVMDASTASSELSILEHSPEYDELRSVLNETRDRDLDEVVIRKNRELSTLRRLTGIVKAPIAARYIRDTLSGGTQKLVVFYHHKEVGEILRDQLQGIPLVRILGSQTIHERSDAVDRFQDDPSIRVALISLGAGNTGITLTTSSDVVFVESDWSPAVNLQAANRVHRVGQTNHVWIRFLALAGSLDHAIQRTLQRKTAVLDQLEVSNNV